MPLLDCTPDVPATTARPAAARPATSRHDETGKAPPVSPMVTTSKKRPHELSAESRVRRHPRVPPPLVQRHRRHGRDDVLGSVTGFEPVTSAVTLLYMVKWGW